MKSFKIIFRGLLLLGVFMVFNSGMCTKEDEERFLEANAKGYYFVGVIDKSGAWGVGHVAFFLVSPKNVKYCSFNLDKSLNFFSEDILSTDFNSLYQILVNENPDWDASKMITDITRYDYGFYLEVDEGAFNRMKGYTETQDWFDWLTYHPLSNNCIHYFRDVLGIANANAFNVDLYLEFAFTDFYNLGAAVNGNFFTDYKYWLKQVVKLR